MTLARASTVVVTGASRGIGFEITNRLAADGYRVAAVSSQAAEAHPSAAAGTYRVDVSDEHAVADMFSQLDEAGEHIVGAVTAAGVNRRADAIDCDAETFMVNVSVNLLGTFLVARETAKRLAGGGSIVTVSSTMAFVGSQRRQAPYAASKGGVSALTTSLAIEWAPRGIRVNAVAPTFTETEMNAGILADPKIGAEIRSRIPLGRFGTPADVASAVSWLLGPESSFVTGHTLPVDGGYLSI